MKAFFFSVLLTFIIIIKISALYPPSGHIRILVITGGHSYNVDQFNQMMGSLGDDITYQVVELPEAFDMFLPENRSKYDVLIFYHMWQTISEEQAGIFSSCIRNGKPVVVLHHSICAFDNWPEYIRIVGGKYFQKPAMIEGKEVAASTYLHDVHFKVKISDPVHPVTKGLTDFEILDETYKDYYIEPGVTPLLTTEEPTSTPVIGWTNEYGKARIVTLQSGHDAPAFRNLSFRRLLRQSILWVYQ